MMLEYLIKCVIVAFAEPLVGVMNLENNTLTVPPRLRAVPDPPLSSMFSEDKCDPLVVFFGTWTLEIPVV